MRRSRSPEADGGPEIPWGSDLSAGETLAVRAAGLDPAGLVMATSVFLVGFQAAPYVSPMSRPPTLMPV
ncbi:MAG: hypothetical protein ACRDYD_12985, partial [Acidimicrobiales bacterium]